LPDLLSLLFDFVDSSVLAVIAHFSAPGGIAACLLQKNVCIANCRNGVSQIQTIDKIQFMPLYEYELCDGDCKVCGGKFTLNRPLSAKPLTNCPACKKPVRKIISSFSSPHKLKPLSISDAKKAGFTVLKKVSKGEYERQ
jgi:putative FmdB family regulatory protein